MSPLASLPPSSWPVFLTLKQVADILQASERTVRRRVDAGALPEPVDIGGTVRFRREDLVRILFPTDGRRQ